MRSKSMIYHILPLSEGPFFPLTHPFLLIQSAGDVQRCG
jgi:hypothetical protein